MKRSFRVALLIFVVAVATYKYFYPTYSYRYRLTINVEADGKVHSGSSLIDVTWYAFFLPSFHFVPELRGQAALVDLGERGVVVATLINGEGFGPAPDGAWGALWIVPRAFDVQTGSDELPVLEQVRGGRNLALNNLPRFLWFSNPEDPMTARKVLVQEFPTLLGPSVRFSSASVEIMSDPLVIDIRDKLPWLRLLEQRPPGEKVIYLPNKFPISRSLFIGDES